MYDDEPSTPPRGRERPADPLTPEQVAKQRDINLALYEKRQLAMIDREAADLAALDVDPSGPMTLRQQLAHARLLAQSGVVPAGFRGGARAGTEPTDRQLDRAAADIMLARAIGAQLGLSGELSLMHLQVIEGNIGLKPSSARGLLISRGCKFVDEEVWNRHGVPVAHRITFTRPGQDPVTLEFRIERAVQALLVEVKRDDAGEVTSVRARSKEGKPLPWELYTADMLRHRCESRIIDQCARDLTAGLNLIEEDGHLIMRTPTTVTSERADQAPTVHSGPPGTAPATVHSGAAATPPAGEGAAYDPRADLKFIGGGDENAGRKLWREHAGAQVRRRTKIQLAADRIAAWVKAEPYAAIVLNLHEREPNPGSGREDTTAVDAEVVEDDPDGWRAPSVLGSAVEAEVDDARREVDEKLERAYQAALAQAWSDARDLLGDRAQESVLAWIRTELPADVAAGIEGPEDLRPDHIRLYLRTMQDGPDA